MAGPFTFLAGAIDAIQARRLADDMIESDPIVSRFGVPYQRTRYYCSPACPYRGASAGARSRHREGCAVFGTFRAELRRSLGLGNADA